MSLSRWSKRGQTVLLVAGHDAQIDITIYSDVSMNPGPQDMNRLYCTNTKGKDWLHHFFKFGSSSIDCTGYCSQQ